MSEGATALRDRIHAAIDGELDVAALAELEQRLDDDADAREFYDELAEVAAGLDALPEVQPPAGLTAALREAAARGQASDTNTASGRRSTPAERGILERLTGGRLITTLTSSRGSRAMSDQSHNTFGRGRVWAAVGVLAVTVAVIGYLDLDTDLEENLSGAIAPAERYRAESITQADVVLGDKDIAELLQSDAFIAVIEDEDFAELLADSRFQMLMASAEFQALFANRGFQALLADARFQQLFASSRFQALMASSRFQMLLADARFQQLMASAEFQALMASNRFQMLLANAQFEQLMASGRFQALMADARFQQLMMNAQFQRLFANSRFQALFANASFQRLFANAGFQQLLQSGRFQQLMQSGRFASLLASGKFQMLMANANFQALLANGRFAQAMQLALASEARIAN